MALRVRVFSPSGRLRGAGVQRRYNLDAWRGFRPPPIHIFGFRVANPDEVTLLVFWRIRDGRRLARGCLCGGCDGGPAWLWRGQQPRRLTPRRHARKLRPHRVPAP